MQNSLEIIKRSLRIVYDDDDSILNSLLSASMEYINNAVNSQLKEDSKLFEDELFINGSILLTQYWYLNRGEAVGDHIPVYVTSMIQQLRGKYL